MQQMISIASILLFATLASSHYQNQHWLTINEEIKSTFTRNNHAIDAEIYLKLKCCVSKSHTKLETAPLKWYVIYFCFIKLIS